MVKTTTDYCDDDETIEFFSEFYSYCAERLKMTTIKTTEEEETISSVLEDVTRLVFSLTTTTKKKKKKEKKRSEKST